MEHRLLEYFIALGEELHFTKAADRLGISQPTLSHQIRLLEQELGTPLFQRSGKKNYLTQAGQVLMEHARRVIYELEQAKLEIGQLSGMKRGHLRIGCSGNHLLESKLISFHRQYPGIKLSVVELATEETHAGLLGNQLDLGVVFLPLEDEQLVSRPLFDEELVLVASRRHELAELPEVPLEQLSRIPLILFPPKFFVRQLFDAACAANGISLKPVMELSTMDSQVRMARSNVGGTILPASYAWTLDGTLMGRLGDGSGDGFGDRFGDIAIIPLAEPAPRKQVGLVYRKNTFMDATLEAFIRHLSG
ncbi:MAG: LysR substrate-binding domain-containing protein [Paenibacillus macerans]|uniref:Bacterial regulatory helix-turn-helix, lysR family protein n=1 Tax=Paenibacillus macerans TaxID=44252 RepID=A0A090YB36_PAEMA|nr:LysR substrate-binding domain-containing protein [Paenibacillus macerans]KFM95406.1 bacterial regulatory helix-turn-helix, lysR family protein [Paenibacillus macerans]MBS5912741.1 LysR family transcriptional regulator [Paenibacillus macerans]MCY7562275.1 LysR substrate-binding domain-containing protein [Paenibacillus macerans]MDU5946422.1 LysR substrate-binding domain-containing protein [Paenibacillus macerans]MDU7474499.1 LysR substrate-binding domain-containing protein [Paenibacillus mace